MYIVQGDHGIPIPFTVQKLSASENIEGATVEVAIHRGDDTFTKAATILDAAKGECEFVLTSSDLTLFAKYEWQWTAYFPDGRVFSGKKRSFTVSERLVAGSAGGETVPVIVPFARVEDLEALQLQLNDLQEKVDALQGGGIIQPPTDTIAPVLTITAGGTFTGTESVTMAANEPADIYYTLDGSMPTTSSTKYTAPLAISATTTLKAFARDTTGNESAVQTVTYTLDDAPPADTTAPVLTITPAATFTDTQTVNMSTNETATIWYTLDDSDPKTSGTKLQYTGSLTLTTTDTIKAYAVDSANNASAVQTVTYTKEVPADTTAPNPVTGLTAGTAGSNSVPLSWTLSTSNDVVNYEVAYSTDGINFTVASGIIDDTVNDYTVVGLISAVTYTFRVVAIDGANNRSTGVTVQATTMNPDMIQTLHMDGTTAYLRAPVITFNKIEIIMDVEWGGAADYYFSCRNDTTNPAYATMNTATTDYNSLCTINYSYMFTQDIINVQPIPRNRIVKAYFDLTNPSTYNPTIFARDNITGFLKGIIYDVKFYNAGTLVAHYDTKTGTVNDQSGNGNHATLVGGQFVLEPPYEDMATWVGGVE
jgi:hypothetical protein